MASFSVHVGVAATASALSASALVAVKTVDIQVGLLLWGLGMFGGILPDIDSDTSRPVQWLFNGLGLGAAVLALVWSHPTLPLWGVWLAMTAAFFFVRPGLMTIFFKLTVHRGVFHSLLAALFCGLATMAVCFHALHLSAVTSWLSGIFVAGGFVVHLLLDELYSVDFNGMSLKSSFGTAIKPLSLKNWPGSLALIALCAGLIHYAPETRGVQRLVGKLPLVSSIQDVVGGKTAVSQ